MSSAKVLLMNTMGCKIKQVRHDLSYGFHNPELMAEIGLLNDIIKLVTSFEDRLMSELDDID
jgi:hypothetical protein